MERPATASGAVVHYPYISGSGSTVRQGCAKQCAFMDQPDSEDIPFRISESQKTKSENMKIGSERDGIRLLVVLCALNDVSLDFYFCLAYNCWTSRYESSTGISELDTY